jgi:hypothetical protein
MFSFYSDEMNFHPLQGFKLLLFLAERNWMCE